ncbi:MAG: hypothetical protein AB7F86_04845 [Bdellovibrionales bacterium]
MKSTVTLDLVGPMWTSPFSVERPVVFVDGGTRWRPAQAGQPTVSVGDGDSGDQPLDFKLNPDKDFSDLAFVLGELPKSVRQLNLYGFLGGRRDHEVAGFGEIHRFLLTRKEEAMARFFDLSGVKVLAAIGPTEANIQGRFSLMVMETSEVRLAGACQYKLDPPRILRPFSSHGLSNEGTGKVRIASEKPYFLFLNPSDTV